MIPPPHLSSQSLFAGLVGHYARNRKVRLRRCIQSIPVRKLRTQLALIFGPLFPLQPRSSLGPSRTNSARVLTSLRGPFSLYNVCPCWIDALSLRLSCPRDSKWCRNRTFRLDVAQFRKRERVCTEWKWSGRVQGAALTLTGLPKLDCIRLTSSRQGRT